MKTRFIILSCLITFCSIINAQKKYEKIVYLVAISESPAMTVAVKDAISNKNLTKFNLKITNKSNDILVYKPEESKLKANGIEFKPVERRVDIIPGETDGRVINIDGTNFLIPNYSFELNGIYKIADIDKGIETANFQLPAEKNEFKTGNFTCTLLDLDKRTDETAVKFECRYTGSKFGVISPARAAVKLPDGSEIANSKSKQKPMVLANGESEKFTLVWKRMEGGSATDMQKITMQILWRNTFLESDVIKVNPITLDFNIDESKSK